MSLVKGEFCYLKIVHGDLTRRHVVDAQDMEVTRQHIRDAQERLGQTEVLLEENQVQYDQYLENRKMKRACGGKSKFVDNKLDNVSLTILV